ncbi:hypothetical protein [Baekduia sp. Peel2402]|uniref:hypothetical protein n=1 Tax=Baekduia sp. Peel2402 TaxID=3458296 RepID=UPI00403EF6CF
MPHAPLIGRRSLLPVAVLAAVVLATPAAADITVPASGLAHAAGATVVRDDASSSGRALKLATTRSVTTTLSLSSAARTITVRARGISCAGAPTLRVAVDGSRPVTKTLSSGKYQDLTAGTALAAGSHRVAVSLTKAYKSRSCRRAIVVDQIRAAAAAPAPPPVAATATPAPAVASVVTAIPPEPTPSTPVATPTATTPVDPIPTTPTITVPSDPTPTVTTPAPTVTTPTVTTPAPTVTTPSTTTPPVTTPPTDPTPTTPVDTRPKLRWAAPALASPTTIHVPQGDQTLALDTTKDYIIKLGLTAHVGQVVISGGRNVEMIGGTIALPALSTKATALSIKNSTGTVHVEGVQFDGTSGREMDAIQIQAPLATVQVENVRADGILGTYDTNHSDVIQPWGGVARLRVDRLTADSNYQGIFTRPDQGAIGSVSLQNVDMSFNNSAAITASGGYLLWMTTGCDMAPTTLTDVYITPRSGKTLSSAVWPTTTDAGCPAKLVSNKATWPTLPVTGAVTSGPAPGGSFVPTGTVGSGYTSPGYL